MGSPRLVPSTLHGDDQRLVQTLLFRSNLMQVSAGHRHATEAMARLLLLVLPHKGPGPLKSPQKRGNTCRGRPPWLPSPDRGDCDTCMRRGRHGGTAPTVPALPSRRRLLRGPGWRALQNSPERLVLDKSSRFRHCERAVVRRFSAALAPRAPVAGVKNRAFVPQEPAQHAGQRRRGDVRPAERFHHPLPGRKIQPKRPGDPTP